MREYILRKKDRLRTDSEYQAVRKQGKRFRTKNFLVNYLVRDDSQIRLGVITSSKFKKAVARNRAKRLLREFFRLNRKEIKSILASAIKREDLGLDLIFVAYPGAELLKYQEVRDELIEGFKKEAERLKRDAEKTGSCFN